MRASVLVLAQAARRRFVTSKNTEEQAAWRIGIEVAGIAAGVCVAVLPMAAMVQTESKISPDFKDKTIKNDSIRAVDLTNGHPDAVLLRGKVFDTKTKEPIIGAVVGSKDTKKEMSPILRATML